MAVQGHQGIDRQFIQWSFRLTSGQQSGVGIVAEILQRQKTIDLILLIETWGAEAKVGQVPRNPDKLPDVLLWRRGIHQQRRYGRPVDAEVPAKGCISRQCLQVGASKTAVADKGIPQLLARSFLGDLVHSVTHRIM